MTNCVPNGQYSPTVSPFRPPSLTHNPLPPGDTMTTTTGVADPDSKLTNTVSQLRQVHPRLSTAQLGNLIMNQSGQPATYNHVTALRPSYQSATFEKRIIIS